MIGLYVAGWAKRGPVGIIDATLRDTKQTFGILKHHLETGQLKSSDVSVEDIVKLVPNSEQCVSYSSWLKVDKFEVEKGEAKGKVRDKILSRD